MKWAFLAFGSITVFSGVILLLLPIPLGIPLLVVGVPVLMRYSTRMRNWILTMASRFPRLHEILSKIPVTGDQERTQEQATKRETKG